MKYNLQKLGSRVKILHLGFQVVLPDDPAVPKDGCGDYSQASEVVCHDGSYGTSRGESVAINLAAMLIDNAIACALLDGVAIRKLVLGKGRYVVRDPIMHRDEVSKNPNATYYASVNKRMHGKEIYHNGGVIWIKDDIIRISLNSTG